MKLEMHEVRDLSKILIHYNQLLKSIYSDESSCRYIISATALLERCNKCLNWKREKD